MLGRRCSLLQSRESFIASYILINSADNVQTAFDRRGLDPGKKFYGVFCDVGSGSGPAQGPGKILNCRCSVVQS